jgi:hypothetical protein
MVESWITNLTQDVSFGHNLCFRCPNGSCEPILDIYISIVFQWYKDIIAIKVLIQWVLTPVNALWRFGSPLGLQLPRWEFTWECEGSFLHTLLHSQKHEMWLPCFPLGPQPCKPLFWSRAQVKVQHIKFKYSFQYFIQNQIIDLPNF